MKTTISHTIKLKKYFNDIAMSFDNVFLIMRYTAVATLFFMLFFIYFFGDNIAYNAAIGTNTWNALQGTLKFKEIDFITSDGTITQINGFKALLILSTDLLNIVINAIIASTIFFTALTGASYLFLVFRSNSKNTDLHKDKIKRGGKILENEEYIEYLKENKPEELENNSNDFIQLSPVYKVEEFKETEKIKIETLYNKELKEAKNNSKIILKKSDFIKDASSTDKRFFKFQEEGSIKLHYKDTFQHMAISGSSGSGKSVFVTDYITNLLKRFDYYKEDKEKRKKKKLVILDLGEEFTTKFYNQKEWIKVNPFSSDGYYINDFDYIENELQITSMAEIRIPDEKGNNSEFFTSIKRSFLKAGYAYCILKDKKENRYLYEILSRSRTEIIEEFTATENKTNSVLSKIKERLNNKNIKEDIRYFLESEEVKLITLRDFLKNTRELISDGQQAQTNYISLREMLSRLTFLKLKTKNINLRNWIKEDERNLIVSVPLKTKAQSMSIASAFFDVLGRELLNIGENFGIDEDREIHLIIDEFTNISKINIIIELLTLVRKYQVSVVLTYQEVSRIQLSFSKEELEAFENNIATKIFFQSSGEETIKNISSKIGKQDLEFSLVSNNMGVESNKDGANLNRQIQEKSVITEAEIMALKPFQFIYVRKGSSLKNEENKTIFITAKIQGCIDLRTIKNKREDMYSDIKTELQLVNLDSLISVLNDDEEEKREKEERKRELLDRVLKSKTNKDNKKETEIIKEDLIKDSIIEEKKEIIETEKDIKEDINNLDFLQDLYLEENKPEDLDLNFQVETEQDNPYN